MASSLIIASIAAGLAGSPMPDAAAFAQPLPVVQVQAQGNNGKSRSDGGGDCRAAVSRALQQSGGTLLSVRPSGGQCLVTVLIPGKGNARPRKETIPVPR
ncbi:hypothetical protein HFC70_24975 [Agrobacterium sp. a22-2]|uniref:hypothetical protein n=1 Tax=Agrobacterium sp. a22-2 TaxID=2283840 RepID=UPI001444A902|nr:hypothetical protein [Agrobacterium sp. a22-2]NKN39605.1 hypothetical protein [Agrobacterium sp. a22-2]